jgi:hypothetical protein
VTFEERYEHPEKRGEPGKKTKRMAKRARKGAGKRATVNNPNIYVDKLFNNILL